MNKLHIIGNVVRAPELRTVKGEIPVCTFTVAVNMKGKDKEETLFFRVTAWRKLGELCNRYLDRGRKVAVVGSIGFSAYVGKDGGANANLEVTAEEVEFLGGKQAQPEEELYAPPATDKKSGYVVMDDSEELPF